MLNKLTITDEKQVQQIITSCKQIDWLNETLRFIEISIRRNNSNTYSLISSNSAFYQINIAKCNILIETLDKDNAGFYKQWIENINDKLLRFEEEYPPVIYNKKQKSILHKNVYEKDTFNAFEIPEKETNTKVKLRIKALKLNKLNTNFNGK